MRALALTLAAIDSNVFQLASQGFSGIAIRSRRLLCGGAVLT